MNNISNKFIRDLAKGPLRSVITYPGYYVNGYKFHTVGHGSTKSTTNSGVCIKGTNNSVDEHDYYGRLVEVVELEYPGLPIKRTILFKCEWFDTTSLGTKVHPHYKLVDINQNRRLNQYDPFVLAIQATQVFYSSYPSLNRTGSDWLAVCKIKARSKIELPQMIQDSEHSVMSEPFQEETTNVQDSVEDGEDPTNLHDLDSGLIELEDESIEIVNEFELEDETNDHDNSEDSTEGDDDSINDN